MGAMSQPTLTQRRILENHLLFTSLHRADVIRRPGLIRWESASDEFCCTLLESGGALSSLPAQERAARTFPWTGDVALALGGLGFEPAGCVRYMTLGPDRVVPPASTTGIELRLARSPDELAGFSGVQSRSFLDPGERLEPLYEFLHAANLKNLNHPAQTFYVGCFEGRPVAVTLLLIDQGVAGIYAVATLPEFRRRGFSRRLLARAVSDARRLGCETVTLQVHRGSEAERLYLNLGFSVEFDCVLWSKRARP